MGFLPWLDDETDDVGLPLEGPDEADEAPMPKAEIDPAVRQSVMDKYNLAASSQGVDDARENAKYMKAGAGIMDNLGTFVSPPTTVVYKNGWNDASAPKTQSFGGMKTSGDAFRDAAKTGIDQAKEDRANKITGFEQENKLNNQQRQQGREDTQDGYQAEEMGQKRTDWSQKAKNQSREDSIQSREDDQDSRESQMARDIVKQMSPGTNVDGMSASQLKAQSPTLEKIYKVKMDALSRQDRLNADALNRRDARDFQTSKLDEIKTEKKVQQAKLTDKQAGEVVSFDKAIEGIDNIMAQKGQWDTGKLSMGMNTVAGLVGMDDSKKTAFKADVGDQLASYIKNISGATVSAQERASLMAIMPSVYDNDDTFMEKSKALKARLIRNRQLEVDSLDKQGKDTSQWQRKDKPKTTTKETDGGVHDTWGSYDQTKDK